MKSNIFCKNFNLILVGSTVSNIGNVLYNAALAFWVFELTGSTTKMSLIMIGSILPKIILSPIAGVIIDKYKKKHILIITDVIRGIFIILMGVLFLLNINNIELLFITAVILSICDTFFQPSISAILSLSLDEESLIKANSIFSTISTPSEIAGKSLVGFLLVTLGAPILFIVDGITFLISAISELFITVPNDIINNTLQKKSTFRSDIMDGIHFIKKNNTFKNIIFFKSIIVLLTTISTTLILPMFTENNKIELYGILIGFSSFGYFLGSLITTLLNITKIKSKLYITSIVILSFCLTLLPFISNNFILAILMTAHGSCNCLFNVITDSTIIANIPKDKFGKVISLVYTIVFILAPLGMLTSGILGDIFGIRNVISSSSIIILFVVIIYALNKKNLEIFSNKSILENLH